MVVMTLMLASKGEAVRQRGAGRFASPERRGLKGSGRVVGKWRAEGLDLSARWGMTRRNGLWGRSEPGGCGERKGRVGSERDQRQGGLG